MEQNFKINKRQIGLVALASLLAIAAHIAVIYSIKDLALANYAFNRFSEDHFQKDVHDLNNAKELMEVRKDQNEQLRQMFNDLYQKQVVETKNIKLEFIDLAKMDFLEQVDSEVLLTEDLTMESKTLLDGFSEPLFFDNENFFNSLEIHSLESELYLSSHSNDVLFLQDQSQDQLLVNEIVQATNALVGKMDIVPDKLEMNVAHLAIGREEEAALAKMALEDRFSSLKETIESPLSDHSLYFDFSSNEEMSDQEKGSFRSLPSLQDLGNRFLEKGNSISEEVQSDNEHWHNQWEAKSMASIASSHDFVVEVEYASKGDGKGYLFQLRLVPKSGVTFKRIAQNVFFLIDRSHSIDTERYEASKAAVLKVLPFLKKEDTFNILVFDDKISKLSEESLSSNQENQAKARVFLQQQKHGGIFATTDLYSSLGNIVPAVVADHEVNIAILLSDGDTFLTRESQRQTIGQWTKRNSGKVSLFTVAAGKGNDLALLDLLSSFNKGSLYYTPTFQSITSELEHLMHIIQNPIGKDIVATIISSDGAENISIYPKARRLSDLYEQKPYVFYGSATQLKEFYLFLQGKYYDKWLDIKQLVSFGNAKQVPLNQLERKWVIQKAYDQYDCYLQEGGIDSLVEVRRLLAPYQVPIAFQ